MKCRYCQNEINTRSKYCLHCGKLKNGPKRKRSKVVLVSFSIIAILSASIYLLAANQTDNHKQVEYGSIKEIKLVHKENGKTNQAEEIKTTPKPATEIKVDTKKEVSEIITESLAKVFTIFTEDNQGTGFIINDHGDILTNAHVVEGSVDITAIDYTSQSYAGKVIGYSNIHDVAIIRIPELANQQSLGLATQEYASIGEEVIALGSPLGKTNTATLGTIAAINRSFYIGERIYENIYQMTARISPGSSGGPLVSVKSGKVIGINSARSIEDESIGFSIPLKDVYSFISGWVSNPLSESDITGFFYTETGDYHFEEEDEEIDGGYFEGGETTDEPGVYYEIPEDWYEVDGEYNNQSEAEKEDVIEGNLLDNKQEEQLIVEPSDEKTSKYFCKRTKGERRIINFCKVIHYGIFAEVILGSNYARQREKMYIFAEG